MALPTHPLLILALAGALPLGLTACQNGDANTDDSSAAVEAGFDPYEAPGPTEFDESTIEPDGSKSVDGQVVKNIKKWSLPTDPYKTTSTGSESVAENIFLYKCLTEKNVNVPKPKTSFNPQRQNHPDLASDGYSIVLTPENAAKYGYTGGFRLLAETNTNDYDEVFADAIEKIRKIAQVEVSFEGPDGQDGIIIEEDPNKANDPAYKALSDCQNDIYDKAPFIHGFNLSDESSNENKQPTLDDYLKESPDFAVEHFRGKNTPYVKKAIEEWKACMRPQGIPDLPDDPERMPTESMVKKWFPEANNSSTEAPAIPTQNPEEFMIAKQDADCRQSSGYLQKSYDVQWSFLQDYVKKYQKTLRETKQRQDENEKKRQEYIKENQ